MGPNENWTINWVDRQREPQNPPDPRFPNGVDIVTATDSWHPTCSGPLPYPAPRCGVYVVHCQRCGARAMVTTAGRPDDPRSLKMPCRPN